MKLLIIALFATAASAAMAPLHTVKERIDGSYIVVFNDDVDTLASVSTIRDNPFLKSLGARVGRIYQHALSGFSATLSPQALEFVRRFNFVKYVEEDQIFRAAEPQPNATWGLDRIDQRDLPLDRYYNYSDSFTGKNVTVYVIDTGINDHHVDFEDRATQEIKFTSLGDNEDCNGHGTHCAGTVGGTEYGVAKNVTLKGVKVLNCVGSGSTTSVVGGIDWVASNAQSPAVASMSLGGGASTTIDNAVINMFSKGVTVVVAAGNSNADACNYSPARVENAITVGSTTNTDARSSFSNYGNCVDIFAPGSGITSTWHTNDTATNTISGTSMATPHVAGAAAIYLHKNKHATTGMVIAGLLNSATSDKISDPGDGSPNRLLYVGGF